MNEKPYPDSYWVIPGQFLAGSYPLSLEGLDVFSRLRLDALAEAHFEAFFDLTRVGELPAYEADLQAEAGRYNYSILRQCYPTADMGIMPPGQMQRLLNDIDNALSAGKKVYLHCAGGVGRTGMAVGCWLVQHGHTGEGALERLLELYHTSSQSDFYPHSPETESQRQFVLEWKGPA